MIPIIIPIIITALGLAYIFSPFDFLPEIILGPLGLADDAVVTIIIILSWLLYLASPLVEMTASIIIGAAIIFGLIYLLNFLTEKNERRRK